MSDVAVRVLDTVLVAMLELSAHQKLVETLFRGIWIAHPPAVSLHVATPVAPIASKVVDGRDACSGLCCVYCVSRICTHGCVRIARVVRKLCLCAYAGNVAFNCCVGTTVTGTVERNEHDRGQNTNNRNNDKKLDEGKTPYVYILASIAYMWEI